MSYSQAKFRPGALAEQVVLITGASAGIGEALARQLAQRFPGIRLVLTARRAERLEAIATACEKAGADILTISADLTNTEQVAALTEKALAHFGRVDVLVNNAGYGQMGPIELIPQSAVERQFAVNVFAPVALIRALIPAMREQGGGYILNLSSIAGVVAFPLGGAYSATKFALEALSDSLRMELEPFNIAVTVIEPGPVATEFADVAKAQIADLPNPLESPYKPAFETFATLEDQLEKQMWTSDRVATVMIKALTAKNPRSRYTAATGGDVLVFLMTKLLPTRWVDRFWQRFYGINKMMNGSKS
ncbi:MAG: SDR family oxidoreductase [Cyanobacteria bacterium J06638_22]